MPIIDIEFVSANALPSILATQLADTLGVLFQSPPATTWVRIRTLSPDYYAENGATNPSEHSPVFVRVLKYQQRLETDLEDEATALAAAVARICSRSIESIHIVYEPDAKGRIAFGGKLLK